MSVLVVGSTALDSIKTPKTENPRLLGGSASHAAVAASFFAPTKLVGVVGKDFPGRYVKVADSIKGFREIAEGKHDALPEQAFYMVGTIEEAQEKAEKLAKQG